MSNQLKPFVKWAGGKTQLLENLCDRMPSSYGTYYEPFVGAGAFFLYLAPETAVINDTNSQLINIYRQLLTDAGTVISKINSLDAIPTDKERYYALRKQFNEKLLNNDADADTAALMIWINKHCFNGLYRVNRKGEFNVPYNNKEVGKSIDENNLISIGRYLSSNNVEIRNVDFVVACSDVNRNDFVYFDSPYVPAGDTANFTSYTKKDFNLEDHVRLSELFRELDKKGVNVMLSNNDVPLVHELYKGFNIQSLQVKRAINRDSSKRQGTEVIITNY